MSLAPTGRRARRRAFVPAVAFAAVAAIAPAALLFSPARAAGDAATADVIAGFETMARHLTESMTRDLGLSTIQIPEVEKTNLAAASRIRDAALQWKSGDKASTRTLVQQTVHAFVERERDLSAILTPDQQEIFRQQRTVRSAEMQTRLMRMSLKLDDAQAEKAARLNLDTARRMQEALAPARNPSATTTQKYQAMRAAGRIQEEKDDAFRSFLDKDQWKSYKQQKEQMKEMLREAWGQGGAP
jgi:hypothetical protein